MKFPRPSTRPDYSIVTIFYLFKRLYKTPLSKAFLCTFTIFVNDYANSPAVRTCNHTRHNIYVDSHYSRPTVPFLGNAHLIESDVRLRSWYFQHRPQKLIDTSRFQQDPTCFLPKNTGQFINSDFLVCGRLTSCGLSWLTPHSLGRTSIIVSDLEIIDQVCDEKHFHKAIRAALQEVRHLTGDGLFTAFHGELNWALARQLFFFPTLPLI